MSTIDLIVLGMLKDKAMGAYDIQKLVEYRNISKWVKISTPSIYKKTIQLEKKGLIKGKNIKEGNMPEKVVYTLTNDGEEEFKRLMLKISDEPINIFLNFNAVVVNLENLPESYQKECILKIEKNINILKGYLKTNIEEKKDNTEIPRTGMEVLNQQYVLAEAIEKWILELKEKLNF